MNLIYTAWNRVLLGIQEKPGLFLLSIAFLGFPNQFISINMGKGLILQLATFAVWTYLSAGLYASLSREFFDRPLPQSFLARCNWFLIDMGGAVVVLVVGQQFFQFGVFYTLLPLLKTMGVGLHAETGAHNILTIASFLTFNLLTMYVVPSVYAPGGNLPEFITYSFRALQKCGSRSVPIALLIIIQATVILNLPVNWKDPASLLDSMPYLAAAWVVRGVTQYAVFVLACSNLAELHGIKGVQTKG